MRIGFLIIIVGIIIAVAVFGMIFYLFADSPNPAFPSGYPRIAQNDMYCWTQWWYVQNNTIDEVKLTSALRATISEFGQDFDIPNREIMIEYHNEQTVISVGGSWTKDVTNHKKLTSVIKGHVGDSELIRDDVVMCA
ncbi:hypothetical protein [Nitrosopumilus sp.]|uniref:hypothetical protein n=1 Tax=Nitrosopumilus sp. TaxID=2024843 RepID=UPI003D0E8F83